MNPKYTLAFEPPLCRASRLKNRVTGRLPRYELCLVPNGVRAIEEAENKKIDLAFLDIDMPEMDGIEALQRWKKLQPGTQIVMISSFSDGNLVREAIEKGAYTYLFKPLNKIDIFSVTVKSLKSAGIHDVL